MSELHSVIFEVVLKIESKQRKNTSVGFKLDKVSTRGETILFRSKQTEFLPR